MSNEMPPPPPGKKMMNFTMDSSKVMAISNDILTTLQNKHKVSGIEAFFILGQCRDHLQKLFGIEQFETTFVEGKNDNKPADVIPIKKKDT